MIKIYIDEQKCIGAGHCVRSAPDVFDQREDDGIVVLLTGEAPDSQASRLKDAVELCPAQAIRIETIE